MHVVERAIKLYCLYNYIPLVASSSFVFGSMTNAEQCFEGIPLFRGLFICQAAAPALLGL